MSGRKVLVCVFAAAAALVAQRGGNPPKPQQAAAASTTATVQPGVVQGRVISATTGEPLRKATLTLRLMGRGTGNYSATTDESGNFRFAAVDPGRYTLVGERNGFVRALGSSPLEVTAAQTVTGVELKLMPQGVITGRITDEDGDPVRGVNVQTLHYSYPNGRRQLTIAQGGSTNDLGEFRIADLLPGRYYLSATKPRQNPGPGGRGGGGRGSGDGPEIDYVTTYYPQVIDPTAAAPLDLTPGSELRGMDVRLVKARLYRIRGVVSGFPAAAQDPGGRAARGGGGRGVSLNLNSRASSGPQGQRGVVVVNPADGTFEVRGVLPGSYYLNAQSGGGPQQERMTARVPVDVGNADVENVPVRLTPPLTVTGVVQGNPAGVKLNTMRVGLVGEAGQAFNSPVKDDGTFQVQVAPDRFSLNITGVPEGYYVKSVKLAGREVPDGALDFNAGLGPVEIVLGSDPGDLAGVVQNSRGEPAANVQVTVVPASASSRRDLYKSTTTDANGSFTVHGLAPGEYQLYAWEELEPNAWLDADYRKPFDGWSAKARVESSATPNVTLNVITRK